MNINFQNKALIAYLMNAFKIIVHSLHSCMDALPNCRDFMPLFLRDKIISDQENLTK